MTLMKPSIPCLLAFLVQAGCGGTDEPTPLCDPSDPSARRVALEARVSPERLGRGQAVLFDHGGSFLFVDDQCRYWANNPSQVWDETRSGRLEVEDATRLGRDLHFQAWHDLGATWTDPRGGVFDAPVLIFDDGTDAVVCVDFCDVPDVPAEVKAMRDELPIVIQELWDRGRAIVSSVRAVAVPAEPGPGVPFVEWPLARPIADFLRTDAVGFGEGTLEDDVASAQALEDLKTSFLRGDHGAFVWDALPVTSGGAYYLLYVRDALPFEDERGLVPLTVDVASGPAPAP